MTVAAVLRPFVTIALLATAAAALAGCGGKGGPDPFTFVTVDDVERMMREPGVAVIDANTRETFERHHLRGAKHYKAAPFAEVLPPDKQTRLVFYCASPS